MRAKTFPWLGQEFVYLSWEGNGEDTVEEETRALFELFAGRLRELALPFELVRVDNPGSCRPAR